MIRPLFKLILISITCCFIFIGSGCKKSGCMNPLATNFDAEADKDDGSCILPITEDTTETVEIRFVPTMNGEPFAPNQAFIGPNNLRMNMETFKFYLSDIALTGSAGTNVLRDVAFIDFPSSKSIFINAAPGNYSAISFGLGVKKSLNGTGDTEYNPAQWADTHPLSIYKGMYWTWASGYIFTKLEGRIDTSQTQDQQPNFSWFYHIGMDTTYTTKTIEGLTINAVEGQTTVLELGIEVNDLFRTNADTINMTTDYFTHTTDNLNLALKVMNNLKVSIRKL